MTRRILLLWLLCSSAAYAQTSGRAEKPGAASSAARAAQQTWEIDTAQSKLTFSVRHLVGRAEGRFDSWSGTLTTGRNDWSDAAVDIKIKASSVNTENERRDTHLRSADFFDAGTYPDIIFKSTSVKRKGDSVTVAGNLTMKGVTKPVVLKGKFIGLTSGQQPRMTFQATTTINRMDYAVSYNRVAEGGGTILGDDVTIETTVVAAQR